MKLEIVLRLLKSLNYNSTGAIGHSDEKKNGTENLGETRTIGESEKI